MKVSEIRTELSNDYVLEKIVQLFDTNDYHVEQFIYRQDMFGDILMTVCSETVCYRFIKDRSIWSIDVKGTTCNEWYWLSYIRRLTIKCSYEDSWPINKDLLFIKTHMHDIDFLFSPRLIDDTTKALDDMAKEHRKEAGKHFGYNW